MSGPQPSTCLAWVTCNAVSVRILIRRVPRKRRKGVLGSRGEAKRGVTGKGKEKFPLLLPSPPAHFSCDNMVANLLDHELIPITPEHTETPALQAMHGWPYQDLRRSSQHSSQAQWSTQASSPRQGGNPIKTSAIHILSLVLGRYLAFRACLQGGTVTLASGLTLVVGQKKAKSFTSKISKVG